VRIWLAPANLHWCSDKLLMQVKERAQKFGVGIHIHVLETVYQKIYAHRRSGQSAVQHLHALGFLGPEVTLGHGVWLTSEDVDRLAETGTCVCHNASSNLRLQSGIAPLNDLMARGVRVALGIDEAGLNDDRDMLQEMRLVLKLHRVPGMEQRVPTAAEVFSMATEGGAHTTGFGERIGRIAPGRSADAVLIDLRNVTEPYLDPLTPILEGVVHRARAADVDTVMIAGEVVMRDRRFTRVDKDEVLRDLRTALGAPLRPDEIRRRELSRELLPQVRRFYSDWSVDPGDPWYARNNR
jgi:cytosine/adenosine deaminase-related metal-dependent hydrolase